jgi:uncharacterized SAM-binding protein YcdF (DUF218 family)
LSFFEVPSNLIALAPLIGGLLFMLNRRAGVIVGCLSVALVVVTALGPIGNLLLTPLEQCYADGNYPKENIEGIIVLGGSYDTVSHGYLSTIVLEEDTEPMAVVPDLARRYPQAKIIFSGGTGSNAGPINEALIVKGFFISFGIAPERIVVEDRSQTTRENAQFTANLIRPSLLSRWLLVTSAYHMPRAMGTFRKAGFNVLAFPVGFRTHGWREMWWPDPEAADNWRRLDIAAHEWIGLSYYKLRGYSDVGSCQTATK